MHGDDMTEDRRGWHIDKGIPPAVIVTIILSVIGTAVSVTSLAVGQDRRIGNVELTVRHIQKSRLSDQARSEKKFDELKTDLRLINGKLDDLLRAPR